MDTTCVSCGKPTEDDPEYYVDGGGQLCRECFERIYGDEDE